jgi:tripartite motif-containing protein 71
MKSRIAGSFAGTIFLAALACSPTARAAPIFVQTWGSQGSGPGQFGSPRVVAVGPGGNVYVADIRVQMFTGAGAYVSEWGDFGSGQGQFTSPSGLAIDGSGDVYVADMGAWKIHKFSGSGTFIADWQIDVPADPFAFASPSSIAVDRTTGTVFCTDFYNNRIQVTTGTGGYIGEWGSAGSGDGQFNSPRAIALDRVGNVYVADTGNSRIQKFTTAGQYLGQWPAPEPVGLVIAGNGDVYVVENLSDGVEVFSENGTSRGRWGTYGSGPAQFDRPWGIALDGAGNIYVVDTDNHRVQKFFDIATPTREVSWGDLKWLYR